ncbi:MAG TPA: FG-GAP-like repeat-containing protein [Bryobacteraceae bacterium]|jgi:tetratricopeptide (TPR) repeat protein
MSRRGSFLQVVILLVGLSCGALFFSAPAQKPGPAALWHYRNLGKAFYENPTTQAQAVEQFRKALELAPNSVREQVNYGLALLRAGDGQHGMEQLRKVQKEAPDLPYTWFNLGISLKKQGDLEGALPQFRGMARLVPDSAVTHYQIGTILKSQGDLAGAIAEFELARKYDPGLAAPHFQLYGLYRQTKRAEEAAAELKVFQEIKKENEGAAVPEDMEWCYYSEIYDPADAPAVRASEPVYRSETLARDVRGVAAVSLTAGARASLISWSADRVMLWNGKTATAASGLEGLHDIRFIAPGDFDNDGLIDLAVVTAAGASLYRNENGKFRKQAELASGSFQEAVWLDFDHDYDLDLVLLGQDSKLYRNNGSAGFSDETARFPFVHGHALSGVRFDVEPDTPGFDLAVSYQDRAGVLYRDLLGGSYKAVDLAELPAGATRLADGDWNHDGRTDLAAQPDLTLLNRVKGFEKTAGARAEATMALADLDGSGRLSRAHVDNGALVVDRDATPAYGNWIEVALTGVKNLKSGLNAKVEVKAGANYSKQTYDGVPLVFRLGPATMVETVRITWPNGLIQNELNQPVNKVAAIKEAPRLSGSCPMIFTWDGRRFRFITDVLGVAPLGASSSDGQYFPVDHDEYVSIGGDQLRARDGVYDVRITEELREVTYLDQVKLMAVDHPANVEIVSNEKFKSPPFPEFRLFGIERPVHPIAARDGHGADVLGRLLRHDGRFVDTFRRDQTAVAEMHTLDLDFGKAAASNNAVLVLDGFVDWADGSTFLSAAQEHKDLAFPSLQVKDAEGKWKTVIEDMGMPSGRPKRIAVDLSGKFLSSSREVRIVTNLCVYWDEIFLAEGAGAPRVQLTNVPNLSADLRFRGFSRIEVDPERKQPERFDYSHVSETAMWNPTPGRYTRYGDVRSLIADADDRMVIMGSGDEAALRFDGRGLPAAPSGWTRDFLLYVDGWAKDADANTAFSQSVLPLPFHGMSTYPYPAAQQYPEDTIHTDYQQQYNTRLALRLIRSLKGE